MTSEIYIFSGLGADERVFINLDFSDYKYHFINWIPPLSNESIEGYAKRISNQINTPNPIIIGLSFGGMISIEIAKQMNTHKVILISSAKTSNDIPLLYRIIGAFRIHKIMPYKLFKKSNYLTKTNTYRYRNSFFEMGN
jgi:esterase/lipase